MRNWSEQMTHLKARRAELKAELSDIEARLDDEPSKDWEDRATERQSDEVLESLGTHDLSELRQIDAALARIADGTYGDCMKCGEEIGAERLSALPATPFCMACAR